MQLHAVVLHDYSLPPRELLKGLIERCTSLSHFDAARVAAKARGIVAEVLPYDDARRLAEALTAAGYPAYAVPRSALAPMTQPKQVRYLNISATGLRCEALPRTVSEIAWERVQVLALGLLIEETQEVEVEAVRISPGHSAATEYYHTTKFDRKKRVSADLIAEPEAGDPVHLRIIGNDFNYSRSIETDPKGGWLQNFTKLLAKLGLAAASGTISPAYEAFILARDKDLIDRPIPAFNGNEEFESYTRWLWQRRRCPS
jgi:hypothetical protein